jgi:hypothetical protein
MACAGKSGKQAPTAETLPAFFVGKKPKKPT